MFLRSFFARMEPMNVDQPFAYEVNSVPVAPHRVEENFPSTSPAWADFFRAAAPEKYSGSPNVEELETFFASLHLHLPLLRTPEETKVYCAACLLSGEALRWWAGIAPQGELPPHIRTIEAFKAALFAQFVPAETKDQAMYALRKLKQGKDNINVYVMRFRTLVGRTYKADDAMFYQHFLTGLNAEHRPGLSNWVSDQRAAGRALTLDDILNHVMRLRESAASPVCLKDKDEQPQNDEPQYMDIDAIGAARNQRGKGKSNSQQKICFFCKKPNHIMKDCRYAKGALELLQQNQQNSGNQHRKNKNGNRQQGNQHAPAQHAAARRGPQQQQHKNSQETTHQGSNQP